MCEKESVNQICRPVGYRFLYRVLFIVRNVCFFVFYPPLSCSVELNVFILIVEKRLEWMYSGSVDILNRINSFVIMLVCVWRGVQ